MSAASEQSPAATATLAKLDQGLAHFAMPAPREPQGASSGLPAGPVPLAAASNVADPSWQEAAQDIHLRQGIVSLVDGRTDAALLALQQAKDLLAKSPAAKTPDGNRLQAGLDRLVAIAADPLLPPSLRARSASKDEDTGKASGTPPGGAQAKATASIDLCLKLGHIDNLLGRYDAALDSFTLAGTISRSMSTAQRSFESLGLARAIAGRSMAAASAKPTTDVSRKALAAGEPDAWLATAKSLYQRSLKEHPGASWHDETLHELASLIERVALQRFPPLATPSAIDPGKVPPAKPVPAPTDAQRLDRAKSLAAARAEALPYWLDLSKRFPKSRYAPQALYHVGMLATEANQPDEAIAAFADLVKDHSDSPWTPDAQVRLIDVKLEQQFDLPGAAALAASAVAWCEQNPADQSPSPSAAAGNQQSPLAPGGRGAGGEGDEISPVPPDFDPPPADLPPLREVQYNIYLRAGLIEYLQEHKDPALAFFEKAKQLEPKRDFVVAQGEIPTGIAQGDGANLPQRRNTTAKDAKDAKKKITADANAPSGNSTAARPGEPVNSSADDAAEPFDAVRILLGFAAVGGIVSVVAVSRVMRRKSSATPQASSRKSRATDFDGDYDAFDDPAGSTGGDDGTLANDREPAAVRVERTFDPYHVWLSIPPDEQPPNHYRLLGLAAFESDREVIEEAADRQMAHLRTFQLGQYAALSQELLNEVSAAKGCLLSPTKKPIYDAHLRRRLMQASV